MTWKPEYAKARREKARTDPEYMAKRNRQATNSPNARKEYNLRYYRENPEKYKLTPEQRARKNAARRKRYAEDAEWRMGHKKSVMEWRRANPDVRKNQRLLSTHGIELSDYQDMLAMQNGRCAICGYSDMSDPRMFPVVDHDHKTGAIRGLLCMNCNQGLGKFKDETGNLFSAIAYLTKHS